MLKKIVAFVFAFTLIFIIDQGVKYYTLHTLCDSNIIKDGKILMQEGDELFTQNSCAGKRQGEYISLVGTLNTGVAFSMFSGKEELKFVHLGLLHGEQRQRRLCAGCEGARTQALQGHTSACYAWSGDYRRCYALGALGVADGCAIALCAVFSH